MNIKRQDAWELLNEYVKEDSLIKHCLAVEAAMRAYAQKWGENEEEWGIAGLIHDFDYEKYPTEHPVKGSVILQEKGYPKDIIEAILGHNQERSGVERKTLMAKALFAVDELAGMVMATAYVRPDNFVGMKPKSVKKNLKKKGFAATISRKDIQQGIEELGVDIDEHISLVIAAMSSIAKRLGFNNSK